MLNKHHSLADGCSLTVICSLVVWMLVAVCQAAYGKDVYPEQAVEIAKKYITLSRDVKAQARAKGLRPAALVPYYIYNDAQGRGFVVVAGDDDMGDVLAYSTEGTLDTLQANPGVKLLLEAYRQTYDVLKEGRVMVQRKARSGLFAKTVSPLLKSKWGQSHPFNAQTGYPYSGCVATAVAQMMYYYQWPAQGSGKNEYRVTYYNTMKSADFSQSHYDWANMLPDYNYPVSATKEQEDAVALLMNDVGVASFMQYTPASSGTQGIFAYQALQKIFDYTAAYVTKAVEGPTRFAQILRQELLNGCPVYLEGRPAGNASGHAWVTDGFDENGLFHMNFGWDGQGDAYYSLTNLSLSQTGSEFQGKPLAFNRAIMAILAHPNNGKYPAIERGLLESSPQLMFNEGGAVLLKDAEDKSFLASQSLTIEMNSFVNKGKPFKGDVGIAVYDAEGTCRQVAYTDDHAIGGFTQRLYGGSDAGFMGSDYLVNQVQSVKMKLTGLENGYYRLVPVCVAQREDGSWDEFFAMKKAPIIEVELSDGRGRISEICSTDVVFQLMSQPRLSGQAEQGGKVLTFFTLKNLNGVPRDCYLRVRLLDDRKAVVLNTRVDELAEIEGFTEAEIPIVLSLPSSMTPGRYEVQLSLSADAEETVVYPVNLIHDKDAAYIEVLKAQEKPLMDQVEVFFADDSHEKIESGSVDVSKISLFKMAVLLRTSEGRNYEGNVSMFCEDMMTHEKTQVKGIDDRVSVSSSMSVPLFSYWLRKGDLSWEDGHTYRVMVMGEIDGQQVELADPQSATYYLHRKGDILTLSQGTPTSIGTIAIIAPSFTIKREGGRIIVSGTELKSLRLYDVAGRLLQQTTSADGKHAVLTLQGTASGISVLRIDAGRQCFTYRLL